MNATQLKLNASYAEHVNPRWVRLLSILAFNLFLLTGTASASTDTYMLSSEQSKLSFKAKSTLHSFEGEAPFLHGLASWDSQAKAITEPATLEIPVSKLTTKNAERDEHMRQMFEAEQFPSIELEVESIQPQKDGAPNAYLLEGNLSMHGSKHAVSIPVSAEIKEGQIFIKGKVKILTTWFNLKPPSVIGIVRVSPEIWVNFETVWNKTSA